ncbi:hypothetical protein SAMD00019534_113210, partial [Acytostelium subglobosum LB1]|uniref:hypothetical protein n=1 Tax=Acytostelium subglobosum LB1 TaxID=1410327 RepID=UPI000644BBE1
MTLDFHKDVYLSCSNKNDCLVVMAKGLGLHHVILAFLKLYSDSDHLVLYLDPINESLQEAYVYYTEQLLSFGIKYANLPTMINQEQSGSSKSNMYKKGGCYFAQASIFALDFLTKRMPSHLISGIIVNNAHRITDLSTETLLIRLYRQSNKTGFVKAFSTDPAALTQEIGRVQRVMKYLGVNHLDLWPCFQAKIQATLDKTQLDLLELHTPMTESMVNIEKSLLETIQQAMVQLQKQNKNWDKSGAPAVNVDDGLFSSFDSMVQNQLKPIWGDINKRSKHLISNIKELRMLSNNCNSHDCVTFLKQLEMIANRDMEIGESWIHSPQATTLFRYARERVYRQRVLKLKKSHKKLKTDKSKQATSPSSKDQAYTMPPLIFEREFVLEDNPKWNLLVEIFDEINEQCIESDVQETVLVFVKNETTCHLLQEYLTLGGRQMLQRKYDRWYPPSEPQSSSNHYTFRTKPNYPSSSTSSSSQSQSNKGYSYSSRKKLQSTRKQKISETNYRKKMDKGTNSSSLFSMGVSVVNSNIKATDQTTTTTTTTQSLSAIEQDAYVQAVGDFEIGQLAEYYGILPPPYIVIHPITNSLSILEEKQPRFIVVYDMDMSIIRQIEVYNAESPNTILRTYCMIYKDSMEERKYVSILNREQESFEKLIYEKSKLVLNVSENVDDQTVNELMVNDTTDEQLWGNSRAGGRRSLVPTTKQKVIVDSHEFKSSLPVALQGAGFEIVPKSLESGDYVITPSIAIERKSIPDLVGSFQSGRLYAQIEAMSRLYRNPVLLIEYDNNQPFTSLMTPEEPHLPYISQYSLSSKLVQLARAFPRLRILWSRSAYSTVGIYKRLKKGNVEPDPDAIKEVPEENDASNGGGGGGTNYHYGPQDVLRKLPGITELNIKRVMDGVRDLHQLAQQSLEELCNLLGSSECGRQLFDFFNHVHGSSSTRNNGTT